MKGSWLTMTDAAVAMGKTPPQFAKYKDVLKTRPKGKRVEYFLPEKMMTAKYKKYYADVMTEFDDEAQDVEEVIGDVTDGIEMLPNNSSEMLEAKLANIKARTALIEQKLEEQKQNIWNEWNAEFFETFAEAFAKLKNELISMHLNEEQINALNEKLDNAITLMKDKLDAMWNKFVTENEESTEV